MEQILKKEFRDDFSEEFEKITNQSLDKFENEADSLQVGYNESYIKDNYEVRYIYMDGIYLFQLNN